MTQKDKDLLLKDLCARLPYGVKVQVYYEEIAGSGYFDETVWLIDNDEPFHINDRWIENIKPYLRPMSSMSEEERDEMKQLLNPDGTGWFTTEGFIIPASHYGDVLDYSFLNGIRDYLDSKHFDHRGLIPKGLALEAPEGMYNIKEK